MTYKIKHKKWNVAQNYSGKIGEVKAKTKKGALKKSKELPMYDYWQKTKVKEIK